MLAWRALLRAGELTPELAHILDDGLELPDPDRVDVAIVRAAREPRPHNFAGIVPIIRRTSRLT
jgi:hypothetical protein